MTTMTTPQFDCLRTGTLDEHEPPRMRASRHAFANAEALTASVQSLAASIDVARWEKVLDLVREQGIAVVEMAGWRERGRPYDTDYQGLLDHHTATSASAPGDYPSSGIVSGGRPDLPGPLAQVGCARSGAFWMIAAGYSNHAGGGGWRGLSGNYSVIGIECENNGIGQPWTEGQVRNLPIFNAIICHVFGFGPEMLCRHAEWSDGGKIDTATSPFDNGVWLRQRTAEELARINGEPVVLPAPGVPAFEGGPYREGDEGQGVKVIQTRLNQLGASLVVDGDFGPATATAVRQVQAASGLVQSGVVGQATWNAMWKPKDVTEPPAPPAAPLLVDRPQTLAVAHTGYVLDVADRSLEDGARIVQWPANGNDQQRITLEAEPPYDGKFIVRFAHSGKVLDHPKDTRLVHQWTFQRGNPNQLWRVVSLGHRNIWGLESVADGQVLDLHDVAVEPGAQFGTWDWNGNDNQVIFRNYLA